MLKFLIDHNIPKSVSDWLFEQGYDVQLVKEIDPEMSDSMVLDMLVQKGRVLLTNDSDFKEKPFGLLILE